jgi:hypothetical protein
MGGSSFPLHSSIVKRLMRWLLHGNLAPAVADALKRRGDTPLTLAEAGIETTDPAELLKVAHQKQLDLMTTDTRLVNLPFEREGVAFGRSIVFLQLAGGEVEQDDAIERLFKRYKRLTPGRLYTVTASRVKIRQLPG